LLACIQTTRMLSRSNDSVCPFDFLYKTLPLVGLEIQMEERTPILADIELAFNLGHKRDQLAHPV
jgi:hypothetical protein